MLFKVNVALEKRTIEKNEQFWEDSVRRLVTLPLVQPTEETKIRFSMTCKEEEPNSSYGDEIRCDICAKHTNGGTLNKVQTKRVNREYLIERDSGQSELPDVPMTSEIVIS